MRLVDITISVKRPGSGPRPDILALLSDIPGLQVLGGEPDYAVDVRLPQRCLDAVRDRVGTVCDVEEVPPLKFLSGAAR